MAIMTFARDSGGQNTFAPDFSKQNYHTILSALEEQTLTVPQSSQPDFPNYAAIFSVEPGLKVYVALNGEATVPSGSFEQTLSQLNPTARRVMPGDVLHFITSETTAIVSVSFYAIK
jgi:hypothetical protein